MAPLPRANRQVHAAVPLDLPEDIVGPAVEGERALDQAQHREGLAEQAAAKKDLPKAREWLDVGLLHYPDDTALWFLSAYYHHVTGDKELTLLFDPGASLEERIFAEQFQV